MQLFYSTLHLFEFWNRASEAATLKAADRGEDRKGVRR